MYLVLSSEGRLSYSLWSLNNCNALATSLLEIYDDHDDDDDDEYPHCNEIKWR